MIKIRIDKASEKKLLRNIQKFHKTQIPYAASLAVNELGNKAGQDIGRAASVYLDRPTPFTKAAYVYPSGKFKGRRATKRSPVAILTPAERQARDLYYQIRGGTDTRNKAIPASGYPLNQYGNLARRATKGKSVFFFRSKRGTAMAARVDKAGDITPIALFNRRRAYRPIYPIRLIAERAVLKNYKYAFRKAFERAHGISGGW